jgi:AcrR family transcriptional regulator
VRLADIAATVGISAPAFYKYFNDLDEAILVLCEDVQRSVPVFSFSSEQTLTDGSRDFVVRFFEYWDANRPVLHARNVAITSGDARIAAVRERSYRPLREAVQAQIEAAQAEQQIDEDIDSTQLAFVLSAMLDRMAAIAPQMVDGPYEKADISTIIDAIAFVFDSVLGTREKVRTIERGGSGSTNPDRRSGRPPTRARTRPRAH